MAAAHIVHQLLDASQEADESRAADRVRHRVGGAVIGHDVGVLALGLKDARTQLVELDARKGLGEGVGEAGNHRGALHVHVPLEAGARLVSGQDLPGAAAQPVPAQVEPAVLVPGRGSLAPDIPECYCCQRRERAHDEGRTREGAEVAGPVQRVHDRPGHAIQHQDEAAARG